MHIGCSSLDVFWQTREGASGPATYWVCSLLWLHCMGCLVLWGRVYTKSTSSIKLVQAYSQWGSTLLGTKLPCTDLRTWLLLSGFHRLLGGLLPSCLCTLPPPCMSAAEIDASHTSTLPSTVPLLPSQCLHVGQISGPGLFHVTPAALSVSTHVPLWWRDC